MPKDGPCCICLLLILIDSVFELNENYYMQGF